MRVRERLVTDKARFGKTRNSTQNRKNAAYVAGESTRETSAIHSRPLMRSQRHLNGISKDIKLIRLRNVLDITCDAETTFSNI